MKLIKKISVVFICMSMIFASGTQKSFASTADEPKFKVSVETDKGTYGIGDTAHITISVKNISQDTVGGIVFSFESKNLVLKNEACSKTEIGEMKPNEIKSVSLDVGLSRKAEGLRFIEKVYLFFTHLFSRTYSFDCYSTGCNKSKEQTSFCFKYGKTEAEIDIDIWYSSFSQAELNEMNTIEKNLSESIDVCDSLLCLKEKGMIKTFSESLGTYWFTYSNGVLGGVVSENFSDSKEIISDYEFPSQMSVNSKTRQSFNDCCISKALVLYSFNYPSDDQTYRRYFYDGNDNLSCFNVWGKNQMYTDIDDAVTVSDIKNIDSSYDVICFCGHGSVYEGSPVMCLTEKVTDKNKSIYADDLLNGRVAIVQYEGDSYYWIFPSLFENCYKENEFEDKVVFMQCCNGFGNGKKTDYSFSEAFIDSGASAVVGFKNEVNSGYCRNFMRLFVENYASGMAIGECFTTACEIDSTAFTGNEGIPFFSGYYEKRIDDYSTVAVTVINRTGEEQGIYRVKFKSEDVINLQKIESALHTLYGINADLTQNINVISSQGEIYEAIALM